MEIIRAPITTANLGELAMNDDTGIPTDHFIAQLNERLPKAVVDTFTADQIAALKLAFGAKKWSKHPIDLRDSFRFFRWRFYFVFVAGRDKRNLSERRYKLMKWVELSLIAGYLIVSMILGVFALYLLKSALGINIFSDFSFGVWSWFKELACAKK